MRARILHGRGRAENVLFVAEPTTPLTMEHPVDRTPAVVIQWAAEAVTMRRGTAARGLSIVGAAALFVAGCQLVSGLGELHVVEIPDAAAPFCEAGASQACYSGDPATRGHGVCHDGAQVCAAAGDAFEACKGDVLPAMEENCAGDVDLDCDGKLPACHGDTQWIKAFGGAGDDRGVAISTGKGGAAIFAGSFSGSVDFGSGALVSAGGTDLVVSPIGSTGVLTDARRFGGTDDDAPGGLCGDDIDNILLAGRYRGAIDFGDGKALGNAGDGDAFVTVFDVGDTPQWTIGLGDAAEQEITAVVSDAAIDVLAVGRMAGTITTPVGTISTDGTLDFDAFVIKLSPTGAPLWIHKMSDSAFGDQRALAVTVDRAKAVIVGGTGQGDIDLGQGPLKGGGGHDAFLVKLDSSGAVAWGHVYGDAGDAQSINAVTAATNDDILVAGSFDGTLTFDQPLTSAGLSDLFVARLDPAGKPLWSRRFGDAADQAAYAVAVDKFDNVYVGGTFDGTLDLGKTQLVSAGGGDAFLIKLDPKGNPLWGRRGGDAAAQRINGIVVDRYGVSTVVGTFEGTLDFGTPLVSAGGTDIFLARFSP
ncbi:MAG: hypothetical protein ABJE95_06770 [Byssovorax sp.]